MSYNHLISVTKQVTSYETACKVLDILPTYPKFVQCAKIDRKSMIAYHQLTVIIRALNILPNGKYWKPDFNNWNECKWRIWWQADEDGRGCSGAGSAPSGASASVGSRLIFRSKELADYCAKQFKDLWSDYILM